MGGVAPNIAPDVPAHRNFHIGYVVAAVVLVPAAVAYAAQQQLGWNPYLTFVVAFPLLLFPSFGTVMYTASRVQDPSTGDSTLTRYFRVNSDVQGKFGGRARAPIDEVYYAYCGKQGVSGSQKLHLKEGEDMLEVLRERHSWSNMHFTMQHLYFFVTQWIPELLTHSRVQDTDQVREHYDRGNDFYGWFLGNPMVYTSGIVGEDEDDSLDELQRRKLDLVCHKAGMQKGDRHLDIGCGWGTLVIHAAREFGTCSSGVTLARNQTEYATQQAASNNVKWKGEGQPGAEVLCMDYRDMPWDKGHFKAITCLEMAEHVGVKNFLKFLVQCRELLDDDGTFFLQIAGLRRAWQYEDLLWGLFMAKHVFPGADASCPLGWVIDKLEEAGYEVQSMDNVGIHYSITLNRWYDNWVKNKDKVVARYGEWWYRIWEIFLAWSTLVSEQGSATCYQLVCHKNLNSVNRRKFFSGVFHRRVTLGGRTDGSSGKLHVADRF